MSAGRPAFAPGYRMMAPAAEPALALAAALALTAVIVAVVYAVVGRLRRAVAAAGGRAGFLSAAGIALPAGAMSSDQGYDDQFDGGLFRVGLHASARAQPRMWPKSVSEMRRHTSYGGQGLAPGYETSHSDFMRRRPYHALARLPAGGWAWIR